MSDLQPLKSSAGISVNSGKEISSSDSQPTKAPLTILSAASFGRVTVFNCLQSRKAFSPKASTSGHSIVSSALASLNARSVSAVILGSFTYARLSPAMVTSAVCVLSFITMLPGMSAIRTSSPNTNLSSLSVPAKNVLRFFHSLTPKTPAVTSRVLTPERSGVVLSLKPAAATASFRLFPEPILSPFTFTVIWLSSYSTEMVTTLAGMSKVHVLSGMIFFSDEPSSTYEISFSV